MPWQPLRILRFGGPEVLQMVEEATVPDPGPEEFKGDMATLFKLLREGAIHPIVIDRLPLAAASEVHARIDRGGLGGKMVLLPWSGS